MYIEKSILKNHTEVSFNIIGIDFDKNALNFAKEEIQSKVKSLKLSQINIFKPHAINDELNEIENIDFVICMGLFDYLTEDTTIDLLKDIKAGCNTDSIFLFGNYHPSLSNRIEMEWMLDWWLEYKSKEQIQNIILKAGFEDFYVKVDETDNYLLAEVKCGTSRKSTTISDNILFTLKTWNDNPRLTTFFEQYFEDLKAFKSEFKNDPKDTNTEKHYNLLHSEANYTKA